jgi:hypothetical protein
LSRWRCLSYRLASLISNFLVRNYFFDIIFRWKKIQICLWLMKSERWSCSVRYSSLHCCVFWNPTNLLATIPVPKVGRDTPAGKLIGQSSKLQTWKCFCSSCGWLIHGCEVARLKNHPGALVFTLTPSNRDDMKAWSFRYIPI